MPSKDWEKIEGKHGIYRRKRKSDPSKYEYLCVISFGYTEEYNEKTGKMRKKENRSQKIFQTLKEAEGYQDSYKKDVVRYRRLSMSVRNCALTNAIRISMISI